MLKHVTKVEVKNFSGGFAGCRLFDPEGKAINAFDRFSEHLITHQYAYTTGLRYSSAAAKFIDYLYEIGIMGDVTSNAQINRAVDVYPIFLSRGNEYEDVDAKKVAQLRRYAEEIKLGAGLARNTFAPTLAAINLLLVIAQDLADEAIAIAKQEGSTVSGNDPLLLIKAINGSKKISFFEKQRLRQNSLLGSVMRLHGEIHRPRKLRSPIRGGSQLDSSGLDFPFDQIRNLIDAATCFRDKTLYSLLAASGIRIHEGLNLTCSDVDFENRMVYVRDPYEKRFGRETNINKKIMFKGRSYSKTFLFEPYKTLFFEHLEKYLDCEHVATKEHDYLFQIITGERRGMPLKDASFTALEKSFKKTVLRAKIPGPPICPNHIWTPHSLRHAYGVYMLNFIPHQHGRGISLEELQMLMGHKNINSTRHYARTDRAILEAKLAEADDKVNFLGDTETFVSIIKKLY